MKKNILSIIGGAAAMFLGLASMGSPAGSNYAAIVHVVSVNDYQILCKRPTSGIYYTINEAPEDIFPGDTLAVIFNDNNTQYIVDDTIISYSYIY